VVYRSYQEGGGHEDGSGGGRKAADPGSKTQVEKERKRKQKATIVVEHVDIIGDAFWNTHPDVLAAKHGEVLDE